MRIKKKGESGLAVKYITRNKAVKKLQVSLFDFRRLCILKGIHPHEPSNKKKANKGSTAARTFYYAKDIALLGHEPVLEKLRERRAFYKKIKRALSKKQTNYAEDLKSRAPNYTLDHLVKERYPTFVDALRDIDDALSMVFLFATLPPVGHCPASVVAECQQLSREFLHFVIQSRTLCKVFLSIKGIYYQAEIRGQKVTWLVPYQFCQKTPRMVDFAVMKIFLEFYRVLLGFVNFRLFSDLNLQYPPVLDESLEAGGADLAAVLIRAKDSFQDVPAKSSSKPLDATLVRRIKGLNKKLEALKQPADMLEEQEVAQEEEEMFQAPENEAGGDSVDVLKAFNESAALTSFQSLFAQQHFFLSREVPKNSLEFVIRAFGGKVGWDATVAAGSPYDITSPVITYIITDRPVIPDRRTDCIYVQPQWVYDCINARKLLKESPYFPGSQLPPHLSPFVEYKDGDYIPDDAFQMHGDMRTADPASMEDSDQESAGESSSEEQEEMYKEELRKEAAGTSFSESKPAPKPATKKRNNPLKDANKSEEADMKEMSKVMMSKKQKYLSERIQKNSARKEAAVTKLLEKKKALKKK
ncbi:mRNA-binding ribosome synthesis protein nop7 [Massospora cicadina]|nr:mRNA-binding ribosome synthesis protein nop7 [Massospora cicadina]